MAETYEGEPCVRCGSRERHVSSNRCAPCMRRRSSEWTKANPERNRERQHRYYRKKKASMPAEEFQEWTRQRYIEQTIRNSARDMRQKAKGASPDATD